MADISAEKNDPRYGKGTARVGTIKDLAEKRQREDEKKRKSMFREQIIFFLIAGLSITPWVIAFTSEDQALAYTMFKVGAITLIGLYPLYLLIRTVISLVLKKKKPA